ncbi:MAG: hypothetical protein K6C36_06565 [Clostridia bacterium]|nr:hypothetical protein [Clostridia bacterium]
MIIITVRKRSAAVFLAALILAAVAAALIIVVHEADHDCTGEGCPICAAVAVCQNTLKTLSAALAVCASIAASGCFAAYFNTVFDASLHKETPVSLKVKLLD